MFLSPVKLFEGKVLPGFWYGNVYETATQKELLRRTTTQVNDHMF